MKGIIELTGMEFHAFHGCLETERTVGNRFLVDFSGRIEMGRAVEEDCLEGTADYSRVYSIVRREMETPSALLEHVAGRIVRAISDEIPEFETFTISVAKQRPPVEGVAAWSKVTLNYPYED